MFSNLFRKSCHLLNNVVKYGGARGATNDVTIWRIRVACWVSKSTWKHAYANAHEPGLASTYKHKQVCNIYCCFTATRHTVTLSVLLHLWKNLVEFFLEWEIFYIKFSGKSKQTFDIQKHFPLRKSCRLCYNVGKYGGAREATDDNIIRRMHFACWKCKAKRASMCEQWYLPTKKKNAISKPRIKQK